MKKLLVQVLVVGFVLSLSMLSSAGEKQSNSPSCSGGKCSLPGRRKKTTKKYCPMSVEGAKVEFKKIDNGVRLIITADNEKVIAEIQSCAASIVESAKKKSLKEDIECLKCDQGKEKKAGE